MTSIVLKAVATTQTCRTALRLTTAVFAVNGTTQAIQAMLMTAVKPGGKFLFPQCATAVLPEAAFR